MLTINSNGFFGPPIPFWQDNWRKINGRRGLIAAVLFKDGLGKPSDEHTLTNQMLVLRLWMSSPRGQLPVNLLKPLCAPVDKLLWYMFLSVLASFFLANIF
jgi:hypothetical protein